MLVIGLTGGIGSGKSTVSQLFADRGVPIIDADAVARDVVAPGTQALQQIIDKFGPELVNADGQLNRSRLREIIFADPHHRHWLEALLHPLIRTDISAQIDALAYPYCIVVIPLLIESQPNDRIQRILVVDCPEQLQLERTAARDNTSLSNAKMILTQQASRQQRLAAADDVIKNDQDLSHLEQQVEKLHQHYLQLADEQ